MKRKTTNKDVSILVNALQFYAERTVYERLNQFPGDEEFSPCSDIAEDALHDYFGFDYDECEIVRLDKALRKKLFLKKLKFMLPGWLCRIL